MLERTTFTTVTSLQSLSPGSISTPFSNDGECPEELHLINRSQVRALPVLRERGSSSVGRAIETFLDHLVAITTFKSSPQILANAGADYIW